MAQTVLLEIAFVIQNTTTSQLRSPAHVAGAAGAATGGSVSTAAVGAFGRAGIGGGVLILTPVLQ